MPRPSRFTDDDVLDAALAAVAAHGSHVTVAMIAAQLGGPIGSIYHRFGSRHEILIRLWIRSIRHFQQGYLAAAKGAETPLDALIACAQQIPAYCRENPAEAVALTLYAQERLIARLAPGALRDEVVTLNRDLDSVMLGIARAQFGDDPTGIERVNLAVRVIPYGVVRGLLGGPIPPLVDVAIVAAAKAVLTA